ncbi:MAG TPA: single-stranded-DNA-specific exonuclease RecJ, partial [Candidatus Acidoferrum sp.]|nr:single-stranded-DNA-specific exonuclease RecJ [Candidatus Acidoferrum sp.]
MEVSKTARNVFATLLSMRGLTNESLREQFLRPSYDAFRHNPFLLPDMDKAVERLVRARQSDELVYIYGDYDIDGLTATTILLEAFGLFGFRVKTFIPNRFSDGYGLSKDAIQVLREQGAQLLVTVDCGSLSHAEIEFANSLGLDVIVTDHHSVAATMPGAVAVINPKRSGHAYPFQDLAGCGVAFKLVQALQQRLEGLPVGQEKWLLDLVALGTVCDIVALADENRANVHWGLKVLTKTRRPGLKALTSVAGQDIAQINARGLGFVVGPHLNAAGRLETAQLSLDLLTTTDPETALGIAYQLHDMNQERRAEQDRIAKAAALQAEQHLNDPVLVLSDPSWSHGIIGIVAAKMLEQFHKPTFILQEMGEESKGSARSFGDFSAVEGIRASEKWLIRGGGHKLAAGISLKTENIPHFRVAINDFYRSLDLPNQLEHFEPTADISLENFQAMNLELINLLKRLEPYGHGNHEPVFKLNNVRIVERKEMGADKQHLKLHLTD